jgi:hypothetical protein
MERCMGTWIKNQYQENPQVYEQEHEWENKKNKIGISGQL